MSKEDGFCSDLTGHQFPKRLDDDTIYWDKSERGNDVLHITLWGPSSREEISPTTAMLWMSSNWSGLWVFIFKVDKEKGELLQIGGKVYVTS